MKPTKQSKRLASTEQQPPRDCPPHDALLAEIGALARREHAEAESATDEIDHVFVEQTTASVLAALNGTRVSASAIRGLPDWLKRFKSWLVVPLMITVGATSWLLTSRRQLTAAPDYQLSVMRTGQVLRGTHDTADVLTAGMPATLLLRPATRTNSAPQVQLRLDTSAGPSEVPAVMEADPAGSLRLDVPLPSATGELQVTLCKQDEQALPPPAAGCSGQRWSLPVVDRARQP
jgi:hypothetical protein